MEGGKCMRTSRVNGVTSSIFRNERQYLQSNELFHRVMHDGSGQMPNQQQQHQRNNQNHNQQKQKNQTTNRRNNLKKRVGPVLPLDSNAILDLQNRMLQRSLEINNAINKKVRMHTYRNSI